MIETYSLKKYDHLFEKARGCFENREGIDSSMFFIYSILAQQGPFILGFEEKNRTFMPLTSLPCQGMQAQRLSSVSSFTK